MNATRNPLMWQLETLTKAFRFDIASRHDERAAEAQRDYQDSVRALAEHLGPPRYAGDAWEPPAALLSVRMRNKVATMSAPGWHGATARHLTTSRKWHEDRAEGQRYRFKNLASCGSRVRTVNCTVCGFDTTKKPVPDACGISRLCLRCSLFGAKKRRGRFGRARQAVILAAPKHLHRKKRHGGAYGERMLTLTIPHWTKEEAVARLEALDELAAEPLGGRASRRALQAAEESREILAKCKDTVQYRVELLWRAWPRFVRKISGMWRDAGETLGGGKKGPLLPKLHRAAEWTVGNDGLGHPHYHVWIWSPIVDERIAKVMWKEALAECGAPASYATRDALPVVNLKRIYQFNCAMAAELMKGGKREALSLSRLHFTPRGAAGEDVFSYAEGWTISEVLEIAIPEVVASLYEILEGKRLTQASRGFFGEEPPPKCPTCAASRLVASRPFRVTFAPRPEEDAECMHERGPP